MGRILVGDVVDQLRRVRSGTVDVCVTSPPYYALRTYGVDGQIGLEKTYQEYLSKMVEVFRGVRRTLKPTGTLWLNLGDTYVGTGSKGEHKDPKNKDGRNGQAVAINQKQPGLPSKNMIGIPWRVALALQEDGWILRSDVIWNKPNAMPSSVKDRPASSHEHVFLFSKSPRYFYDSEAVKEPAKTSPDKKCGKNSRANVDRVPRMHLKQDAIGKNTYVGFNDRWKEHGGAGMRNMRDVWDISTRPYKGAHFATFPPELPRRAIVAGTSEKGCCAECGAPYGRVLEKKFYGDMKGKDRAKDLEEGRTTQKSFIKDMAGYVPPKTVGWEPECDCSPDVGIRKSVVLDPFAGSGVTLGVAKALGRDYVGIELNPKYVPLIEERVRNLCTDRRWNPVDSARGAC